MKKNEIIQLKIESIDIRGRSYGYYDGYKVYTNINAAKDQIVEGRVCKIKPKDKKALLCDNEIIYYANRQNQIFLNTNKNAPGCSYQYYSYKEQLQNKVDLVEKLLNKKVDNIVESELKTGYRNKMEFSFGNEQKDFPMILGLHRANSFHDIVEVDNMKLMDENFNKIYKAVNEFCKNTGYTFYHKKEHIGFFRYLIIRKSEGYKEILVNLVTTSQIDKKNLEKLQQGYTKILKKINLDDDFKIVGILNTINDNYSDSVQSDKEYLLFGKNYLTEKIFDLNFKISPLSFFQTNPKTAQKLYLEVVNNLKAIDKKENLNVFDLFSGTGTISQILAKDFKNVYAVEINEQAVEKAKETSIENNLTNITYLCGDVFEQLDNISIKPDVLVVDPPRQGVLSKTIQKLVKYDVQNIVYVSCNPITLQKDLIEFENKGYILQKLSLVDMFPFTKHVECVVHLSKLI